MPDFSLLQKQIEESNSISIIVHRKPDGDAMGSALAFWKFLKDNSKKATVIAPTDYPENLYWLPGNDEVLEFGKQKEEVIKALKDSDIIACLDFNALGRVEELQEFVESSNAYKIMVDHHRQPDDFADWMYSDIEASSTCELIYDVITELGGEIDYDIAVNLYVGILTDTGSFQYSATRPKVHRIAAELLEKGVRPELTHDLIYNSFRKNELQFIGYCLDRRMRLIEKDSIAYMALSMDDIQRFHVGTGGTEGLVNYPMKIKTVKMSVLFKQDRDRIKISFRSKGEVDVNKIAREHFNGGGHFNASGGAWFGTLEEAVERFVNIFN